MWSLSDEPKVNVLVEGCDDMLPDELPQIESSLNFTCKWALRNVFPDSQEYCMCDVLAAKAKS